MFCAVPPRQTPSHASTPSPSAAAPARLRAGVWRGRTQTRRACRAASDTPGTPRRVRRGTRSARRCSGRGVASPARPAAGIRWSLDPAWLYALSPCLVGWCRVFEAHGFLFATQERGPRRVGTTLLAILVGHHLLHFVAKASQDAALGDVDGAGAHLERRTD